MHHYHYNQQLAITLMLLQPSSKVISCTLDCHADLLSSSPCHAAHEYSWMDQYFDDCVLQPSFPICPQVSHVLESQNTASDLPEHQQPTSLPTASEKGKNRSVFHNFQKHLLTLLKKIIVVRKAQLSHLPSGNRAYDLWKIFMGLRSTSKKNLYIVFGVAQRENEINLAKAALEIPELQRLLLKYPLKQIEEGQEILRSLVYRQATHIQKLKLECECKMKKFQEFYSYFTGFLEELSEGAISRRMTKERKMRLAHIQESEK